MPNVSNFGTQTDNAVVQGTVTDRAMVIPDIPPSGLMSVGPRVTPHFVKPSLWSALTTYHFFDAVHDAAGASYVAIKPEVPAGTELTDEGYWFLWADPNSQFADLSELVKTFNGRITQNTADIATKAPNNHASEETTYGVGNEVNYGHVRLATDDTPATSDANAGIAATPKMVDAAKQNKLLVIGDSYTQLAASTWAEDFAKAASLELYKHATSSACYYKDREWQSVEFQTLLTQDDYISKHPNELNMLICYGGINDALDTDKETAQFEIAVTNFIKAAHTTYPNALVYIVGPQRAKTSSRESLDLKCNIMQKVCSQLNAIYIDASAWQFFWPLYYGAYYASDNIHPNAAGYKCITDSMLAAIYGNGWKPNITASKIVSGVTHEVKNLKVLNCGNKLLIRYQIENITIGYLNYLNIGKFDVLNARVDGFASFQLYEHNTTNNFIGENVGHLLSNNPNENAVVTKNLTNATIDVIGEISFRV